MRVDEPSIVRARRVEPDDEEAVPEFCLHAASWHQQLRSVLPRAIVVARNDHQLARERREGALEGRELCPASPVRDVARQQDFVHSGSDERIAQRDRCGIGLCVAPDVEIRDVREGLRHHVLVRPPPPPAPDFTTRS
jgi:hypothetical protein